MGNYTPDSPQIIGNEWVPIVEEPITLSTQQEVGTSFILGTTTTVTQGRFYAAQIPLDQGGDPLVTLMDQTSTMMNVYPAGKEDDTGPLQTVLIPVDSGSLTGDAGALTTVVAALARQGDGDFVAFSNASPTAAIAGTVTMNFDVRAFDDELEGKRIVKVEWVFSLVDVDAPTDFTIALSQEFASAGTESDLLVSSQIVPLIGSNFPDTPALELPRFNILWGTAANYQGAAALQKRVYPWTWFGLTALDSAGSTGPVDAQVLKLYFSAPAGNKLSFDYSALRVSYCEENRVAVGGLAGHTFLNENIMFFMADPVSLTPGVILPAGGYTITIDGSPPPAKVFALRELYSMEAQHGKIIDVAQREGDTFTVEDSPILPQLSLNTSTTSLSDVHGYGRQLIGPVWGAATSNVLQEIVAPSDLVGTATFPWARFYARRFGDSPQDLTLSSSADPTITASITPAEFDALDEIVDGWKEVTLHFTGTLPNWTASQVRTYDWRSNATVGNQWQILAADAVIYDNQNALVTGGQSLNAGTYGGSSVNIVTDTSHATADATLMFAQEMPPVSGLAVETASIEVTGIGLECGVPPECVPTGIGYNALTWTALGPTSIPATGFGFYELQRYDTYEGAWSTILEATSPLVTGFNDFEARVGVESRYRIRMAHRMLFYSDWSAEVATTLPAPGVLGAGVGDGVLIFTTNEVQTGAASLAYAMQWETEISEDFTFLEAAQLQLQRMYGRDFQIAFRPLERGGTQFRRTLLVNAAAITPELMQDGFDSLRDLAWDDISYVCVRDELGDRWLANVNLPTGTVRNNRRLYMAEVDITEVTDTPSVVDLPSDQGIPGTTGGPDCIEATWDGLPGWDYGCWGA